MSHSLIHTYLKDVGTTHGGRISTEHSFRGHLQKLMQELLHDIQITNEPSRIDCGAPDYVLTRKQIPLGYIEAKDLEKSLDDKAHQDQLQRYVESLGNLIFTNYVEFRFYRDGEMKPVATVAIAELRDGKIKSLPENFAKFVNLVKNFGDYEGQTITTATDLATHMAHKAQVLAQMIANALVEDEKNGVATSGEDSELQNQLKAFRETLIADIKPSPFADIYAQTVAYGMFAARLHDPMPKTFTRQEAAELIPKSNPFLRKLFQHIAGYELDSRIRWIVDDLADLFRASDVHELMKDYGKATQKNDPFLHFYETFLGAYDAKLKKSRGVWYTPEPVVNFIVRAVDWILKKDFGLKDGLADTAKTTVTVDNVKKEVHKVQILDPATGTGTFLANIVKHIHEGFVGQQGVWPDYARDELVPRLNGFEILMASYAMAHVKLEMILKETGCELRNGQRLQVFLTDSLENRTAKKKTRNIPFANWLANEAQGADKIKRETPVMVVVGNPPYNVKSKNKGKWILDLIEVYKKGLGEKKLNLDDDYIKFTRYGEWLIEKTGEGVLAYISNNSFIDGITHRQMRRHLLETFDRIYILDLHGSTVKKEICPDGSPDKNVFDIQQGVSINLFVKSGKKKKGALGEVFHCDLLGERESKYEFLWSHKLANSGFQKLETPPPYFFFVPKDFSALMEYENGFAVNKLFKVSGCGVKTERDGLAIAFSTKEMNQIKKDVVELDVEDIREKYHLPTDSRDWGVARAKDDVLKNNPNPVSILYRVFDIRKTLYTGTSKGFVGTPGYKTMRHMLAGDNDALIISRQFGGHKHFICFVSKIINEISSQPFAPYYAHPLYLYPDEKQTRLDSEVKRKPNLNDDIVKTIADKLGLRFTPEKSGGNTFAPVDLLDYIYATLHSPAYREKFREFLKIDFPRVPFPRDKKQFRALAKLGARLRALHLMESAKLDKLRTTYPIVGDNIVTTIKFDTGKVWINQTQHFAKVPKSAWEFYIGGYQPAQKYLKDRKGRVLTPDEIKHYQKIIVALVETAAVMEKIDKIP